MIDVLETARYTWKGLFEWLWHPHADAQGVPDRSVTARTSAVGTSAIRCTGSNEALGAWQLPS